MKSGVYEILNLVNGKRYIGSAKSLVTRRAEHVRNLRRGGHSNPHLQSAWTKYGPAAFVFKPLLICAAKDLLFYEQRCLDAYRPEYNIARDARAPMQGRKLSVEARAKIAAYATGRGHTSATKEKLRICNLGKGPQLSPAQQEKIHLKLRGKKRTVEQRARMSIAARRRPKPIFSLAHRANLSAAGRRMWAARKATQ